MGDLKHGHSSLEGSIALSSKSDSSTELKGKTSVEHSLVADYRDDDEETYESSSDDYFPSSSFSSSSSSCSSPEPVMEPKQQKNPAKKPKETKTKGEMSLDDLPRIENLNLTVPEEDLQYTGKISAIVDRLVVVESEKNLPALNLDSVLFLESNKPLGKVFDTFGPVASPYYCVRFNSGEEIREKGIEIGANVYFAPNNQDITSYVLLQDLTQEKGSDASWKNNNEPPVECIDYSDDEAELKARQMKKGRRVLPKNSSTASSSAVQKMSFQFSQHGKDVRKPFTREQGFPRPATFSYQPSASSCFLGASRALMRSTSTANLAGPCSFTNITIRSQTNIMPPAVMTTPSSYMRNPIVPPCYANVARPPPPIINFSAPRPPVPIPHNAIQSNYDYRMQRPVHSTGGTQIMPAPAPCQSVVARLPVFGQASNQSQVAVPYRKPVFSAPQMFNPMMCIPPPPPLSQQSALTSGAPQPQAHFAAANLTRPVQVPPVVNQLSLFNSAAVQPVVFAQHPVRNPQPSTQSSFLYTMQGPHVPRSGQLSQTAVRSACTQISTSMAVSSPQQAQNIQNVPRPGTAGMRTFRFTSPPPSYFHQ